MNDAIRIDCLKKNYGAHAVLKGVSFHVRKGEIFALLGVNGAGKTTVLECMEGLRNYDSGSVWVNGKMGIQLQSALLPAHIKAMEAIKLFAKWKKAKIDASMLAALEIKNIAKRQYAELSTGQKRRLHLALALVGNPDIVVLDEPTAGLDVEARISLHDQIRKLKAQGKTIVLASHDMAEVETLCDRIAILNDGQIAFVGTVAELTDQVGKHYTISIETKHGIEDFESDDIADTMLTLLEDFKKRKLAISDIKINRGTLEQHFIQIAKGEEK
ncbi:MAG TPA: ABC transporter ATP-binding protein [Candidatus Scatovicinus merdipullorum]|nr:ABC transporter ATP-binding protein [Candidatus Scatovicinus merdipullorum]